MLSPSRSKKRCAARSPPRGASGRSSMSSSSRCEREQEHIVVIGRLNHVAIAGPDAAAASAIYRDALGAKVSAPMALPEHGVTVVFVELAEQQDRADRAARRAFPDREIFGQTSGRRASSSVFRGRRHCCRARTTANGQARVSLATGSPKIGAHGKPVLFLNPEGLRRNPDRTRTGVKRRACHVAAEGVLWQSEPPGFQAGDGIDGFRESFQILPARRSAAPADCPD